MGRKRPYAASTAALVIDKPCCSRNCLANSTIKIAFLLAKPINITNLTWQNTSLLKPRKYSYAKAPIISKGTESIIIKEQHSFHTEQLTPRIQKLNQNRKLLVFVH
jgi:hypothetical protein